MAPATPQVLLAPISGTLTPLIDVPSALIRYKVLGNGIAIDPVGHRLVAPITGQITRIAATGHDLSLTTVDGQELRLIIGIDGNDTHGQGYQCKIKVDDVVVEGQPLVELDLRYLQQHLASPMVCLLHSRGDSQLAFTDGDANSQVRAGEDPVLTLVPR